MVAREVAKAGTGLWEFLTASAIQPVEPTACAETSPAVAFVNAGKAKDFLGANYEARLGTGSPIIAIQVESAMAQRLDAARTHESDIEYIPRDYSRTIKITGITRDVPIADDVGLPLKRTQEPFKPDMQRVGAIREKLSP